MKDYKLEETRNDDTYYDYNILDLEGNKIGVLQTVNDPEQPTTFYRFLRIEDNQKRKGHATRIMKQLIQDEAPRIIKMCVTTQGNEAVPFWKNFFEKHCNVTNIRGEIYTLDSLK